MLHSEHGTRFRQLDEVRDDIIEELQKEKLEIMKQEMLRELKEKYSLENHIDYGKYLTTDILLDNL